MTPQPQQDRCVLTRHDVQSIKDLVFIVGGNSESSAQKAIFEILANNMRRSRPAPAPQCPHWGINRIVPNDDHGAYSGFIDSWECCKPNNDKAIRKAERERVLCELLAYIHPDSRAGCVIKDKIEFLRVGES